MTAFKLPPAALSQHIAVLGKTGSGKTFAVKGAIVEPLLEDGRRVGIVDPTGAWWGLRSSRDGKGPGFPILVLGGDHGDLPLPALGGAAVARLLAEQDVNLVADTTQLTVGERTRWFIDFATALYRLNKSPLHLVLDEAHNFAPKGKIPDPDTGKMLHAANTLASGGRSRGIRLAMITQRPQKLHNDTLTSADTLVAMRVLAPHDRLAVEDWSRGVPRQGPCRPGRHLQGAALMAENSPIEWTDDTWTPIRARTDEIQNDGGGRQRVGWHCEHASPGCKNCYAEGINRRLGTGRDFKPAALVHRTAQGDTRGDIVMYLDEKMLLAPLRRKGARMVFPCSMTDLFGRFVRDTWIDKVFAVMALSPRHTYQVLTKRADRMAAYLNAPGVRERVIGEAWDLLGYLPKYKHGGILERPWPLPNVWAGVSVEDQERADERRPAAAALAAAGWITWVSYEPALAAVDWKGWEFLRWMVSGGESGNRARPTHPDWHRSARDFCAAQGVAYTFKQWGSWAPGSCFTDRIPSGTFCDFEGSLQTDDERVWKVSKKAAGRLLDGVTHDGFPLVD